MNYVRTCLWVLLIIAATYTGSEWAVLQQKESPAPDSARASEIPRIDVADAQRAILKKHIQRHGAEVNRLDLEVQRLERQLRIVSELKADQDRRLAMMVEDGRR